jgi:hypothetical protein
MMNYNGLFIRSYESVFNDENLRTGINISMNNDARANIVGRVESPSHEMWLLNKRDSFHTF